MSTQCDRVSHIFGVIMNESKTVSLMTEMENLDTSSKNGELLSTQILLIKIAFAGNSEFAPADNSNSYHFEFNINKFT